jgi:predicted porin
MKKSLIALAALSAFATAAQAQSSVTIYGTVDVGYGETKTTVSGDVTGAGSLNGVRKTSTTGNGDGGLSTSILGFRGTEDLGGGKNAVFQLEYDLIDVGAGSTLSGTRQAFVGLSDSKLGTLRLGRMASASHGIITSYVAGMANNTVGSIYSAGSEPTSAVSPNMVSIRPHVVFPTQVIGYTSPNMGGLVLNAQYGQVKADTAKTDDTNAKSTFTDFSAKFDSGKLSVGASYQENKTTANSFTDATANTAAGVGGTVYSATTWNQDGTQTRVIGAFGAGTVKTKTTMFGASYNFGVVQPFALYTEKKLSSTFTTAGTASGSGSTATTSITAADATGGYKQKAYELGARVPVNATVMAFASMYDGDIKGDGNGKDDLSGYQVGATYAMSKRTTVYAITGQQKIKAVNTGDNFQAKGTGTSVGLRHTF